MCHSTLKLQSPLDFDSHQKQKVFLRGGVCDRHLFPQNRKILGPRKPQKWNFWWQSETRSVSDARSVFAVRMLRKGQLQECKFLRVLRNKKCFWHFKRNCLQLKSWSLLFWHQEQICSAQQLSVFWRKSPLFSCPATPLSQLDGLDALLLVALPYRAGATGADPKACRHNLVLKALLPKTDNLLSNLILRLWTMSACICLFHGCCISQMKKYSYVYLPC